MQKRVKAHDAYKLGAGRARDLLASYLWTALTDQAAYDALKIPEELREGPGYPLRNGALSKLLDTLPSVHSLLVKTYVLARYAQYFLPGEHLDYLEDRGLGFWDLSSPYYLDLTPGSPTKPRQNPALEALEHLRNLIRASDDPDVRKYAEHI
jgi:hypothetical protein